MQWRLDRWRHAEVVPQPEHQLSVALNPPSGTSVRPRRGGQRILFARSVRPRLRNNPYSEANFKTLKYCPAFPGRFGSIEDARAFCAAFFDYYNHVGRYP